MAGNNDIFHLKKCEYCRGQDGQGKTIYNSLQSAHDAAKYIENERGVSLSVYQCPYSKGWHLTKNNSFQNDNIPRNSPSGTWEFIASEPDAHYDIDDNYSEKRIKKTNCQSVPIIKIECTKNEINPIVISGKVMEIKENINIEKVFKINTPNIIYANMIKNILDGIIDQITVYAENKNNNNLESYTILVKRDIIKKYKINKGASIKLEIVGIRINNISKWRCNKIGFGGQ